MQWDGQRLVVSNGRAVGLDLTPEAACALAVALMTDPGQMKANLDERLRKARG